MHRRISCAILAALLLLSLSLNQSALAQFGAEEPSAETVAAMEARSELGTTAPELYGLDISGVPVSLDAMRGKWVYIDFWATWCKPCMKELPAVVKLSRDLRERSDFTVVGVSLDTAQTYNVLKKTVSKARIGYPVIYDAEGGTSFISDNWGVQLIPSTFLIDPQGRIAARDLSPTSVKQFISLSSQPGAGAQGSKSGQSGKSSKTDKPSKNSRPAPAADKGGSKPGGGGSQAMAPLSIRSSEQLLEASPSTGRNDMRDLEIHFKMPEGSRSINRYQIYISAAAATQVDQPARFNWLYDIAVASDAKDPREPYKVSIRESSGKGYNDAVNMDEARRAAGLDSATAVSGKLMSLKGNDSLRNPSDILVALDDQQREYQIIVPVPTATSQLRYAIAVYDEQLREYVRNGLVQVEIN